MKKTISLILGLLLCFSLVMAKESNSAIGIDPVGGNSIGTSVDPGITPDSALWGLELWWEGIVESFDSKAKIAHAKERLAELDKMLEEGDIGSIEKVKERIEKHHTEDVDDEALKKIKEADVTTKSVIDEDILDNIRDSLNEKYKGNKNIMDGTFKITVETIDGKTEQFKMVIIEREVKDIKKLQDKKGTFTGEVDVKHSEMLDLAKGDAVTVLSIANRVILKSASTSDSTKQITSNSVDSEDKEDEKTEDKESLFEEDEEDEKEDEERDSTRSSGFFILS